MSCAILRVESCERLEGCAEEAPSSPIVVFCPLSSRLRLADVVEQRLANLMHDPVRSLFRCPGELELSALSRSVDLGPEREEDRPLPHLQRLLVASSASLGILDCLAPRQEAPPHRSVPEMLLGQSGSRGTEASPLSQILDEALE